MQLLSRGDFSDLSVQRQIFNSQQFSIRDIGVRIKDVITVSWTCVSSLPDGLDQTQVHGDKDDKWSNV